MRVVDIMTPNPVTVTPNNAIATAIALMRAGGFRRLPVIENGRLVGIVTARDIRLASNAPSAVQEHWYDNYFLQHIPVSACMTRNPITISPDSPIAEAARLMRDHKIGGLPVIEGGRLIGIITETDLLNYLLKLLEEQEGQHLTQQGQERDLGEMSV